MKINRTLSVSVLSGKGGVGKTNIALNLGYCLHKGGHSLLLVDCDLGLANLDVLLGIAPDKNLQDVLDADLDPTDVTVHLGKGGFDFLPAASGVPEMVDMDEEMRVLLLRRLTPLFSAYDFLFLDLGAGITPAVLTFAAMSRIRLVVITSEPTSLTDAYAVIKVLATQHGVRDFHVIVNMVESPAEQRQAFERLDAACRKFLGLELTYLGSIRMDKALPEAVRRQVPLMKMAPNSDAGQDIFSLARSLQKLRASLLESLAGETPLRNVTRSHTE